MVQRGYYLSEEDRQKILEDRETLRRQPGNYVPLSSLSDVPQSPDVFVAIQPKDQVVPGATYNHELAEIEPGFLDGCCLYKLNLIEEGAFELDPVLNPDGSFRRVGVFNIYLHEIPYGFFVVRRAKTGGYLADPSEEGIPSTTTTAGPEVNLCDGRCKFVWVEGIRQWELAHNGCEKQTTTTSTTACPCPSPEESQVVVAKIGDDDVAVATDNHTVIETDTEEETTTTESPCDCLPPTYCGEEDGECTYTYCYHGLQVPGLPDCTTTTEDPGTTTTEEPGTTTTEEPTTTTTPEPGCTEGCNWICIPWNWVRTYNGCQPSCPCLPPTEPCDDICETAHTPCIQTTTLPPPPPPQCTGTCEWWWLPPLNTWRLFSKTCTPIWVMPGCNCLPPSSPGDECAPVNTPCRLPTGDPTTTDDPNTTTTTTVGPCPTKCRFVAVMATTTTQEEEAGPAATTDFVWHKERDCESENCFCPHPPTLPQEECETAETDCFEGPTTTTEEPTTTTTTTEEPTTTTTPPPTTTTTTAGPEGACIACENDPIVCFETTEVDCFEGWDWYEGKDCENPILICETTTTTNIPTSTPA